MGEMRVYGWRLGALVRKKQYNLLFKLQIPSVTQYRNFNLR